MSNSVSRLSLSYSKLTSITYSKAKESSSARLSYKNKFVAYPYSLSWLQGEFFGSFKPAPKKNYCTGRRSRSYPVLVQQESCGLSWMQMQGGFF
jgi:hypothetical protein